MADNVSSTLAQCQWPADKPFRVVDEPGEHGPCYVVMPDGCCLAFNHHATNGVDQARAQFVADACNAALQRERVVATRRPESSPDGYDYIRRHYGVSPRVGQRVRLADGRGGEIRRAAPSHGHYLNVRLDGMRFSVPVHPTEVEYL